jgi:hypothetical protein
VEAYTSVFGNGTDFHRYQYNFTKWSAAVVIGAATIGAKSGASTEVWIDYVFGSARTTHYLYGNNAVPTSSSRVFQQTP